MANKKERTPEERGEARERARGRLEGAMATLEEGIGRILDSEGFAEYLRAMSRFHTYSAHNVALILSQRPDATQVASYRGWHRLGRQVRKGERGAVILVPLKTNITIADEDGGEGTAAALRFGTGHVWDVTQTEGEPVPQPPAAEGITTASEPGRELYRRLEAWLLARGVTVEVADTGNPNGSYDPRAGAIRISERIAGTDGATRTLAHEAAHYIAGHGGYPIASADAESVAEGAAYVVTQRYGIDTGGYSFGYVAGWAEDKAVLARNLRAIQAAAGAIIGGLEEEREGGEGEALAA